MVWSKILIAIDGLKSSEKILESLSGINLKETRKLILTHVIRPSTTQFTTVADRPHIEESSYHSLEKVLKSYQQKSVIPPEIENEIEIVAGDPAEEILRLARIYQTDLIIIGSRGLTGVKRILESSVSSQVVAEASCSVLVVKL